MAKVLEPIGGFESAWDGRSYGVGLIRANE